ncbi:MAG TPA: hypothetical protein DCM86_11685 [Verrucomicrobiales bacterium]|nr:hypothetical protein [Verrucomicrobiales bacterium]
MFGIVKRLLGRKSDDSKPSASAAQGKSPTPKAPAKGQPSAPGAGSKAATTPSGATTFTSKPKGKGAAPAGGDQITVSLLGVVALLPQELQPTRALGDYATVQLSIPLRPILEQLAHGVAQVPLGQIRKLAPEGFFTVGADRDQHPVQLPMDEVLKQIDPRTFQRRAHQKVVDVPEEVTGPFSVRGNPATSNVKISLLSGTKSSGGTTQFVRNSSAPAPTPAASTPAPAAKSAEQATSSTPPTLPASGAGRERQTSFFKAAPAAAAKPAAPPAAASKPAPAPAPAPAAVPPAPPSAVAPAESAPEAPKKIAAPNISHSLGKARPAAAAPTPAAAPAAPTVSAEASAKAGAGDVVVSLSSLSQSWPDEVLQEILAWNLESANAVLSSSEVAIALKQGRVQYPWSRILASLQGGVGADKNSVHPDVVLDLPLQVVAPAFLAKGRSPAAAPKAAVDASIPDLFQSGAAAAAPPAAAPVAAPTPAHPRAAAQRPAAPAIQVSARTAGEPVVAPAPASAAVGAGQKLSVPVAMVDELWSEALKADISRAQIPGLKLEIPAEEVDRSLKIGKIEYTWAQLRQWIAPALPEDVGTEHLDKLVSLPLKVMAPLFFQQIKSPRAQKKQEVAGDIPDLFSGGPAPQPAAIDSAPSPQEVAAPQSQAPAMASAMASAPANSTTQFYRKPPTDLAELFGQPGKRNWTPTEIIQNTLRIKGVSGAVIAMQDGLLVAGQVPSPWKVEATAAFLPQIHGRLSQYLRELNAGDLSNVTLSTEGGTLMIFNAGIIFFAVLTKSDDRFPISVVRLIVAELSRHTR